MINNRFHEYVNGTLFENLVPHYILVVIILVLSPYISHKFIKSLVRFVRDPHLYSAVYAIIRDTSGKILFMQRQNTGFKDGKYQLPAGHLEPGELVKSALARELQEELCIMVQETDMQVVHVSHRIAPDREYFDIYIDVQRYTGAIIIGEPNKCSDLQFFDLLMDHGDIFA